MNRDWGLRRRWRGVNKRLANQIQLGFVRVRHEAQRSDVLQNGGTVGSGISGVVGVVWLVLCDWCMPRLPSRAMAYGQQQQPAIVCKLCKVSSNMQQLNQDIGLIVELRDGRPLKLIQRKLVSACKELRCAAVLTIMLKPALIPLLNGSPYLTI